MIGQGLATQQVFGALFYERRCRGLGEKDLQLRGCRLSRLYFPILPGRKRGGHSWGASWVGQEETWSAASAS